MLLVKSMSCGKVVLYPVTASDQPVWTPMFSVYSYTLSPVSPVLQISLPTLLSERSAQVGPKIVRGVLSVYLRAKRPWAISDLTLFRPVFLPCRPRRALIRKAHDTSRSRITSLQGSEGNKTKVAKSSLPTASPDVEQQ